MALAARAVSVGTTATQFDTANDRARATPSIVVHNNSAVTVFVGGPDVTTSNGVPVAAGTRLPAIALAEGERLYGIVAAATADCRVLESGL